MNRFELFKRFELRLRRVKTERKIVTTVKYSEQWNELTFSEFKHKATELKQFRKMTDNISCQ